MGLAMNKKIKYILATTSLLFVVGFGVFWNNIAQVWGYIDPGILPTVLKQHIASTDIDAAPIVPAEKANVLFLIDVGSTMLFTPKGKLPEWSTILAEKGNATAATAQVNLQMLQCTFGGGGRPKTPNSSFGTSRAGRDVDATNNIVGNPDCYYIPSADNNLTFQNGVSGALMPNDSRMYKMKLVFWRMLEDASLFTNLRFGLATTYQEENVANTYQADFYKVANWGATSANPNGTGPNWSTGPGTGTYTGSQEIQWGIDQSAYTGYPYPHAVWYAVNRAYLRVPFGDYSAAHLRKFRKLINGIENLNTDSSTGPDFRTIDPELIADGKTPLANGIFPGKPTDGSNIRGEFLTRNLIYYSDRSGAYKRTQQFGANTFHWFGKGSGEAVGSALDFFSPPVKDKGETKSAINVLNALRENFPIRERCESNWLIVFTAGDDSSAYQSWEAVQDLYNYTKDNKVVRLKGAGDPSTSNLEEVQLFEPIRTMVIGFVDPTDSTTQALRDKLNKMADAGDDGDETNHSAQAYFANDVPGLIEAMRSALSRVNARVVKQGSGTPLPADPRVAEDAPEPEMFSSSYQRIDEDQWTGFFERFKSDEDFNIIIPHTWDLGILLKEYAASNPGQRRLLIPNFDSLALSSYFADSNLSLVPFPGATDSTSSVLAPIMGLTTGQLKNYTTGPHPSNLMLRWLHGMDYSYVSKLSTVRSTVLSDMGKSNFVIVGRVLAAAVNNQTGYRDFANAQTSRKRTIYVQSNGGMLHALDGSLTVPSTAWARERWAFIPPNVLANQRLAGLKFLLSTGIDKKQTADWLNAPKSQAAFLTDGGIVTQNLSNLSSNPKWGTYLFGSLGRGGNGLYAMDITDPEKPNFLWAVDNNAYSFNTNGDKGSVHFWSAIPGSASKTTYSKFTYNNLTGSLVPPTNPERDYRRLGWNAPAPAIGTTGSQNVGVLAAGMQYDLDFTKNGTIGSAVYVFNPINGDVLKEYNSFSTIGGTGASSAPGLATRMGMMVTPPSLVVESGSGYAESFFVADNRGDIYEGRLDNWSLTYVATVRRFSEATAADNFAIPYKLLMLRKKDNNDLFAFGGTADIPGRIYKEDLGQKNSISSIVNKTQHLFGFRNDRTASTGTLSLRSTTDVKALSRSVAGESFDITTKIPSNQRGWIIDLKLADLEFMREYASTGFVEYPRSKTTWIFASTFLCNLKTEITSDDLLKCLTPNVKGKSHVYGLDAFNGAGIWPGAKTKYLEIDGVKIAGLAAIKDSKGKFVLLFSMSILDEDRFKKSRDNPTDGAGNPVGVEIRKHSDTLGSIRFIDDDSDSAVKGERLNYWREVYTR